MMSSVCLMAETRSSMKSARRDDDYPYLVPLFKLNGLDICPLVITDTVGVLYRISCLCKDQIQNVIGGRNFQLNLSFFSCI